MFGCVPEDMLVRVLGHDFSVICVEVENPKSEARNPKQCPMIQIQMTKTAEAPGFCFEHSNISVLSLFRISDFDIRIWLRPKACFGNTMSARKRSNTRFALCADNSDIL